VNKLQQMEKQESKCSSVQVCKCASVHEKEIATKQSQTGVSGSLIGTPRYGQTLGVPTQFLVRNVTICRVRTHSKVALVFGFTGKEECLKFRKTNPFYPSARENESCIY
jgi:hypothetical protein